MALEQVTSSSLGTNTLVFAIFAILLPLEKETDLLPQTFWVLRAGQSNGTMVQMGQQWRTEVAEEENNGQLEASTTYWIQGIGYRGYTRIRKMIKTETTVTTSIHKSPNLENSNGCVIPAISGLQSRENSNGYATPTVPASPKQSKRRDSEHFANRDAPGSPNNSAHCCLGLTFTFAIAHSFASPPLFACAFWKWVQRIDWRNMDNLEEQLCN